MEIRYFGDYQEWGEKDPDRIYAGNTWNWYLTFWGRRNLEGNIDIVKGILEEVQTHYK